MQKPPAAQNPGSGKPAGYLISHELNDSFVLVNRLLKNGDDVYWLKEPVTVRAAPARAGSYVCACSRGRPGLCWKKPPPNSESRVEGVESRPSGEGYKLKPVRIGLWDQYGGSMTSGWVRWIFEQFEFPFEVVYPSALDSGNLKAKFDVLVFPSGAMPRVGLGVAAAAGADSACSSRGRPSGRIARVI